MRILDLASPCSSWVSFEESTLDDFSSAEHWEAIVGRYVLLFQADPAALLRRVIRVLKPEGIVVFHEADLIVPQPSFPAA